MTRVNSDYTGPLPTVPLPVAPAVKRTLHVLQQSGLFSLSNANYEKLLRRNLGKGPDIYTVTENDKHNDVFKRVCRELGYTPVVFPKVIESSIALRNETCGLREADELLQFPADGTPPGPHPARGITWVKVQWNGIAVWMHNTHWMKMSPPAPASHRTKHLQQTDAMITQVRLHAKKGKQAISLFSGDVNDNDDPRYAKTNWNEKFNNAGLLTIWDEKKVYPSTHGQDHEHTIDTVGVFRDKDVKGKKYQVYPYFMSDHRGFSVFYEVNITAKLLDVVEGDLDAAGVSADPADPDFYATGGNVSFQDYLDKTIYNYPQAVDNSDTTNG